MILDYSDFLVNLSKFGSWWLSVLGYYFLELLSLSGYKRATASPVVSTLIIQIVTEQVLVAFYSIVVVTWKYLQGFVGTTWQGQQLITTTAQIGTRSRRYR